MGDTHTTHCSHGAVADCLRCANGDEVDPGAIHLALVIVGLVISPMHFLPAVHISPELILLIFLPALVTNVSFHIISY